MPASADVGNAERGENGPRPNMTNVGAGARAEAERMVASADAVIAQLTGGDTAAPDHANRVGRLIDHGISRLVDSQIRQRSAGAPLWRSLDPSALDALIDAEPNLLVVMGSHPSGHVRQAAVERGATVARSGSPRPGICRMLSQRALDAIPAVRAAAQPVVAEIFAIERDRDDEHPWMPRGVERGVREIIEQVRCVELCPDLVASALDLFELRQGRYQLSPGVFDHHRHNRSEVDRRAQLLAELQARALDTADEPHAGMLRRLIDFYDASMSPAQRSLE